MSLDFYKYSACGNDFIVLSNLKGSLNYDLELWAKLCARQTGIGADGVLVLEKNPLHDFSMRYFNADGKEVAMCGNGARAISHFAHHILKLKKENHYIFLTQKGVHESWVFNDHVRLKLPYATDFQKIAIADLFINDQHLFVNTGVPHSVFEVKNVHDIDVFQEGKKIRNEKRFIEGTNVNFYEILSLGSLFVRTYERGVENETLACGTGAIASALCYKMKNPEMISIKVQMKGGEFKIELPQNQKEIFLEGKVEIVFKGTLC